MYNSSIGSRFIKGVGVKVSEFCCINMVSLSLDQYYRIA